MNKILPALALLFAPAVGFSQARIVVNGASAVTVVENGGVSAKPIYIEVANPNANAITTVGGTNGWIISEAEFNMVKWDIGTTTGAYTVPYGLGTTYALPLTLTVGTAGVGSGSILFSTYHTIADQYNGVTSTTGDPSDVTNMGPMNTPGLPNNLDNSYNAVDRFWIIDPGHGGWAYGTNPTASSIKFTYAHSGASAEFAGLNNSADESDLIAQRFNSGIGNWGDWLGSGPWAIAGNIGTVTNTNSVTPANFFRSWTLSNSINPLPIVLSSFTAQCDNSAALIQWTTQSEINNDYFTVEKTTDNIHFEQVGNRIDGAGTTSLPSNYSIMDNSPFPGQSYYILYQTDFDGNRNQVGNPIEFTNCGGDVAPVTTVNAYNTTNNIKVQINSASADNLNISLVNMLGQVIFSGMHAVALGSNEIYLPNNISPGIYVLSVRNDKVNYATKLVIGVK